MRHKVSKDMVGNSSKNNKKSEIDIVAQLKCKFHWVIPIEVRYKRDKSWGGLKEGVIENTGVS